MFRGALSSISKKIKKIGGVSRVEVEPGLTN
jgi:hypothetical protein